MHEGRGFRIAMRARPVICTWCSSKSSFNLGLGNTHAPTEERLKAAVAEMEKRKAEMH
jgi:hypothetical protein